MRIASAISIGPGMILLLAWCSGFRMEAQASRHQAGLYFYQLNTADGLSDNYIHSMAIDSSGNLWVGTGDGLNMFNGKTVIRFFQQEYPQITHNHIRQLLCDSRNRIWLLSYDRDVAIIGEDRRFHRVSLMQDGAPVPVRWMLYPKDAGVILFTSAGHFRLKRDTDISALDALTNENFDRIDIAGFEPLYQLGFRQVEPFDNTRYLYVLEDRFIAVDYVAEKVVCAYPIPEVFVLAQWDRDNILTQDRKTLRIQAIDLTDSTMSYPFDAITDQYGRHITDELTNAERISAGEIVLTTRRSGMYLYDHHSGRLINYRHEAADPGTLVNNSPLVITSDKNGWIFLGATPNGVSYCKSDAVIGQQEIFMDAHGHSYNGHINAITTLDNDTYFIATSRYLIRWQRSLNRSRFIRYDGRDDPDPASPGIFYLAFDAQKRLWVAAEGQGIYVLGHDLKPVHHLVNAPGGPRMLPTNQIRGMQIGPDGWMWCNSGGGICRVDPQSFAIDFMEGHPLERAKYSYVHQIWFSDPDHVWVATGDKGAWQYTISSGDLEILDSDHGLISNEVFCFNQDTLGNLYVGTVDGLQIRFTDGSTKTITVDQGLLNNRVEALLRDNKNRIWMGNDVGLSCFSISDTTLKAFDERYGLSVYGFRLASYHQNSDDELVWGTERGIQYFYPDKLIEHTISIPTTIHRIETRDVVRNLTQDATFHLSPANNYVTFYFSSIDYSKHLRTFYAYQLEGMDPDWIRVVDQNSVRYSALPPGEYTFRVRASNDDRVWEDAGNTVKIRIARPLWKRPWFRILALLSGAVLIWYFIRNYRRAELRRKEELETQLVINYFASRINSYRKTTDLLWDVAENCISKLHFEDCVIYLVDTERNILVQTAAYGPKMERATADGGVDFTVHAPIEIPVGQGIVGAVAQSGIAELIPDTGKDGRYIVDDRRRNSELAVPMCIDSKVIGVIDSEHARKHFFTQKHLNILTTIAALCANQMQRVRAEDEKQQAMIEVLKNKQKVTESRLQSLRLQMNPHFLFNALNSIQQMILANEEMVATRYLSRFSKLLRMILVHSDREMVTLKEELDILNLYVDLESIRFKQAFRYEISCDEDLDIDEIRIPTLLIQPFVENAIWHGLMHKEGDRNLIVRFTEEDDYLHCVIEDNGIGREQARALKLSTGHGTSHTSKGIAVSHERLASLGGANGHRGSIEITDLKDARNGATGTRVDIYIPIQN